MDFVRSNSLQNPYFSSKHSVIFCSMYQVPIFMSIKEFQVVGRHLNPELFNPKIQPWTFQPTTFQPWTFQPWNFQPWFFEPWGWKPHGWKVWGWKAWGWNVLQPSREMIFQPWTFQSQTFRPWTFQPHGRDIHIECSKQFKCNLYFYTSGPVLGSAKTASKFK